jgi:hypothetical protein
MANNMSAQAPIPNRLTPAQYLTAERSQLQNSLKVLEEKQGFWNELYMGLAIAAVILGGLSWYSQRRVITIDSQITGANGRIADIDGSLTSIAQTDATNAAVAAGEATERAAKANATAEGERLARIRLEEALAWRRLSQQQQDALAASLAHFSVNRAWLIYNANDIEAFGFASDLAHALKKWNSTEPEPILKMSEGPVPVGAQPPPPRGVVVSTTGEKGNNEAADALVKRLNALGFDASRSPHPLIDQQRPSPTVFVSVELRPEGPQGGAKLEATRLAK